MFQFKRVFCATSWELEGERRAFSDVVGEINQSEAMPRGVLYVPVSLTHVRDKRPLQYTVEENIRDASYYLLALCGDWGPLERNFERDYKLAQQCLADPAMPMQRVALLLSRTPDPTPFAARLESAGLSPILFEGTAEFRQIARDLLRSWLETTAVAGRSV